ncbi:MAG: phosphopantothenoylcysteine decarboxylase [Planctomycetes bacterium]|nr:phosphopantothenoylcysteine decarboxylase [Planctomycetota bacterium]
MARILITSGPTRQYLDPVRYLTNGSSGRMGSAIASACVAAGHEVIVVSGPVHVAYPDQARVVSVVSTEEMLEACGREFPACDGLIATAAPCDYRPRGMAQEKIAKTGAPLLIELIETPDVVAALGRNKRAGQWLVGFALETSDQRIRALVKLERKSCDLIVLNGPEAIDADASRVEVMDRGGHILATLHGPKSVLAARIVDIIQQQLIG